MPVIEIHPQGVCSRLLTVEYDDNGIITKASHIAGCKGNLDGICSLIVGMKLEDVVNKLEGIQCRNGTSCPDQLAKGISRHLQK
ncbi:MAG: TIGR03905 family TSCPD domain-containing protein [Erysipelotrichaceae bacterium]|nr:TIGR03905 family TSCPD domain-containing protein [Erysipelotrichaceae bacterium]